MPYRIAVIPGDGIGPEVVAEGLKVLDSLTSTYGFEVAVDVLPWSSQHYLDTGRLMSEVPLADLQMYEAIYLGALGDPRVERGLIERSVIMTLRLGLDLYINLRPVTLYAERLTPLKNVTPDDVDMAVIRENTEDAYVGIGGSLRPGTEDEVAVAEMIYTRGGVDRCIRYAFDLARSRDKARRVTLVDKSNAIRAQEIWRRAFADMAREYPDIQSDAMYVDAAAMFMVSNPSQFDVIVTTNLFGDILTDLGAVIQGGMGSAASGNIHPGRVSMFEPIHGSAPDIAGQGIANPVGAIAALGMMLDHLGETEASAAVNRSIRDLVVSGRIPSLDARSGLSTSQIGNLVANEVSSQLQSLGE